MENELPRTTLSRTDKVWSDPALTKPWTVNELPNLVNDLMEREDPNRPKSRIDIPEPSRATLRNEQLLPIFIKFKTLIDSPILENCLSEMEDPKQMVSIIEQADPSLEKLLTERLLPKFVKSSRDIEPPIRTCDKILRLEPTLANCLQLILLPRVAKLRTDNALPTLKKLRRLIEEPMLVTAAMDRHPAKSVLVPVTEKDEPSLARLRRDSDDPKVT
jgi:hypothetical protein